MPITDSQEYIPKLLHRNGHLGTIIPHIFHHKNIEEYTRDRLDTPDGDFIDIDKIISGTDRLAILCHGLEGSSASNYISNMASLLSDHRFDIVAMNYRGCSGESNRNLRMYHSGATDDIDLVISKYESSYSSIALIGYSLGANMVLKYAGESSYTKSNKLRSVVGISAPCDLAACSEVISKPSNYIYERRFLVSLIGKLKIKANLYPDAIDLAKVKLVKTLRDFDEHFTGPIHGFKDASEYYTLNSSNRYLQGVKTPTLIINACNDPFLDTNKFPVKQAQGSEYVHLSMPKYGGHVGFMGLGTEYSWADMKALDFITNNLPYEI